MSARIPRHGIARLLSPLACCALLLMPLTALRAEDAATPAGDVPKGELKKYSFSESKIFPGTVREYWLYVPVQYDPAKPACLYVCQDAIQYHAPPVFDQLIANKEMPVTIGVFVTPGKVPALSPAAQDRFNRSVEYDTPDDRYARFLIEELLPVVEQQKTDDGRAVHFSHDGNDRAIAGASSGAICAFTVAWERPESFRRVFSTIGTYVGLRGGDCYPTLIRKSDPKPLRVFLQDGSTDLNIYGGDWWMANQTMERALVFAGYEVNHAWGEGGHNPDQATQIFADAMRWLWKDWPAPIKAGAGSQPLQAIVEPGETWKLVAEGLKNASAPAADTKGKVSFYDAASGKIYHVGPDGKATPGADGTPGTTGQAYGADGKQYSVDVEGKTAATGPAIQSKDIVVRHDGSSYITEATVGEPGSGVIRYVDAKHEKVVDHSLTFPTGVTVSADQSLLLVAEGHSHWIWSFQITADGALQNGQRFHCLHVPEWADNAATGGLAVDASDRLYVATNMGVQVCDPAGRVNVILPTPSGHPTQLCFGGDDFHTLFATCGDRVYSRRLKADGAPTFAEPIKPSPPRL